MQTGNYPYKAVKGTCQYKGQGLFKVGSYSGVQGGSLAAHKTAIAAGPISVTVDASGTFGHYTGGILNSCGTSINHGIIAVGYTSDYYIIKNSWGTGWGESGFARIKITGDGDGMCMIQRGALKLN